MLNGSLAGRTAGHREQFTEAKKATGPASSKMKRAGPGRGVAWPPVSSDACDDAWRYTAKRFSGYEFASAANQGGLTEGRTRVHRPHLREAVARLRARPYRDRSQF